METIEERQKREAAIAEFKARGKQVEQCPTGVCYGTVARKRFEGIGSFMERSADAMIETGALMPRKVKRRKYGPRRLR